MEDIYKNIDLFVQILGMSRTSAVQQWDEIAMKRAFKWAAYFEQVYKKSKSKANAADKISSYLEKACSQTDVKLGVTLLHFKDLSRASTILRKNLLENPYVSNEFYVQLLAQCDQQSEEAFKAQLQSLTTLKATLEVLQMVQGRFESLNPTESQQSDAESENISSGHPTTSNSKDKSQVVANARLLRKCLKNIFKQEKIGEDKLRELHSKLANMVKRERGVDVLLSVLLVESDQPGNEKDERISNYVTDFIQEILVPAWMNNWKYFLQLPLAKLLSNCSSRYPNFLCIHVDLLRHCCKQLQSDVEERNDADFNLNGVYTESQSDEQMHKYYYFLIQRFFQSLTQSGGVCENAVEELIRSECDKIQNSLPKEKNIWKQLSQDMMISTAI